LLVPVYLQTQVSSGLSIFCAPESRSSLPCLYSPFHPQMVAEITGRTASFWMFTDASVTPTLVDLCSKWWWLKVHWFPFSNLFHCRIFIVFLFVKCAWISCHGCVSFLVVISIVNSIGDYRN
jgi:hypothetical protein